MLNFLNGFTHKKFLILKIVLLVHILDLVWWRTCPFAILPTIGSIHHFCARVLIRIPFVHTNTYVVNSKCGGNYFWLYWNGGWGIKRDCFIQQNTPFLSFFLPYHSVWMYWIAILHFLLTGSVIATNIEGDYENCSSIWKWREHPNTFSFHFPACCM